MPVIRPIFDLRNKTPKIEAICLREQKPVFITKNGKGRLVVMSQKLFEEQQSLMELYDKLDEAEVQSMAGAKRISHREVMERMRARLNG